MSFVSVLESSENRDGVVDAGFFDQHRLEAAFQCGVAFDVLSVLVERGGSDTVQFTACQHGFEQVGGIERSFGGSGADDGVQFVDEQDDSTVGGLDLLEHGLEPVFELAAIFRSGDQRPQVQRHDTLVDQLRRHIASDNPLRQPFDDRRLADSGFTDQHRVVLATSREHLDDATDLLVSADDRIELTGLGPSDQVGAVLRERIVLLFRCVVGDLLVASDRLECFEHIVFFDSRQFEQSAGRVIRVDQGQQQVFDREVSVVHVQSTSAGVFEQGRPIG